MFVYKIDTSIYIYIYIEFGLSEYYYNNPRLSELTICNM